MSRKAILEKLSGGDFVTLAALVQAGASKATLTRMASAGEIDRVARGVYQSPDAEATDWDHFAVASAKYPSGVVSFYSAARYWELTDERPKQVWMGFPYGSGIPRSDDPWPTIKPFVWRDAKALAVGIEVVSIRGIEVRVTDPARTVVDMIRYESSRISTESAFAALKDLKIEGLDDGKIHEYAKEFGCEEKVRLVSEAISFGSTFGMR